MTSIFSESWCGIVFDGRNQQYGAYELRKSTERNMLLAILFSVSILSVGINIILLENDPNKSFISVVDDEDDDMEDDARVFTEVELQPPPANEPEQAAPTPPQPEPTPVPAATERFTVPIIVDEATSIIDTVPSQDSFGEAQAGATTQAGEPAFASVEMIESSGEGNPANTIWERVEIMPEYPGGETSLLKYIAANTEYPDIAVETGMEATVHVLFVIDRDGSLTDVRVARKNFKCLDEEAVRVVQSMPKWKPGKQNGETVRVRYVVPIRFELN